MADAVPAAPPLAAAPAPLPAPFERLNIDTLYCIAQYLTPREQRTSFARISRACNAAVQPQCAECGRYGTGCLSHGAHCAETAAAAGHVRCLIYALRNLPDQQVNELCVGAVNIANTSICDAVGATQHILRTAWELGCPWNVRTLCAAVSSLSSSSSSLFTWLLEQTRAPLSTYMPLAYALQFNTPAMDIAHTQYDGLTIEDAATHAGGCALSSTDIGRLFQHVARRGDVASLAVLADRFLASPLCPRDVACAFLRTNLLHPAIEAGQTAVVHWLFDVLSRDSAMAMKAESVFSIMCRYGHSAAMCSDFVAAHPEIDVHWSNDNAAAWHTILNDVQQHGDLEVLDFLYAHTKIPYTLPTLGRLAREADVRLFDALRAAENALDNAKDASPVCGTMCAYAYAPARNRRLPIRRIRGDQVFSSHERLDLLCAAAHAGDLRFFDTLFETVVDRALRPTELERLLLHACMSGNLAVVQRVWVYSTRASAVFAAMREAAEKGALDCLEWLAQQAPGALAGTNDVQDLGESAAIQGHADVLHWLHIHYGLRATTALLEASIKSGELATVRWTVENGEAAALHERFEPTVLMHPIMERMYAVVQYLWQHGFRWETRGDRRDMMFVDFDDIEYTAHACDHLDIVRLLLPLPLGLIIQRLDAQ